MKVAFLEKPLEINIKDIEKPEPKSGEIRIKLLKTGICGSDVHVFLGHRLLAKPTIIGHEGLGIIDKIGEGVANRSIGERVVVEPNIPCRKCKYCLSGRGNICINKRVVGINEAGCFAEYICLPQEYCWAIPDDISDDDAVTIEPMAVACRSWRVLLRLCSVLVSFCRLLTRTCEVEKRSWTVSLSTCEVFFSFCTVLCSDCAVFCRFCAVLFRICWVLCR